MNQRLVRLVRIDTPPSGVSSLKVVKNIKVSLMTFMDRQHSLTTRFVSMVFVMKIHDRRIVRLVNTLDDLYQAVVLDNPLSAGLRYRREVTRIFGQR